MLAIAAGTDYGIFLIGRYQEARREGEDRETAYYTTFKGVAPVVLGSGPDHCRCDILPELRPAAVVLHHGCAGGDRHAGRGGGRPDAGPGSRLHRQQVRAVRNEEASPRQAVASGRHRGRALACTSFRGERRRRSGRHGRVARVQDELQRSALPARIGTVQHRLCRRRSALLRSPDESGPADGRVRPRHAQHRPTCWCWTRSPRTRSAPSASR